MKKFIGLVTLLIFGIGTNAQTFKEDFETFEAFEKVAAKSENFRIWGGEYDAGKDGVISTAKAHSGDNSMFVFSNNANGGPIDIVWDLGGTYASGYMEIEFWIYVAENTGGYFNIQASKNDGENTRMQCYMYNDTVFFENDSIVYTSIWKPNTWQKYSLKLDLTKGEWGMYVDDNLAGTFQHELLDNTVTGIDFYPIPGPGKAKSSMWIDDLSYKYTPFDYPNTNYSLVEASAKGGRLNGEKASVQGLLRNESNTTISSLKAKYNYNGNDETETFSNLNIMPGGYYSFTFTNKLFIDAAETKGQIEWLEINGAITTDDDNSDNTAVLDVDPISPVKGKMVMIEEGTGTWCGWCPRGAVTLDRFHDEYSEYSAGVAVHYGDPMVAQFYTDYMSNKHFTGYPSGKVNRDNLTGMGFEETQALFYDALKIAPKATFDIAAEKKDHTLNVTIDFQFKGDVPDNWRIGCILIEDEVTGVDGYSQANYYAGGARGEMGGYEKLPNVIPANQMVYNHVARYFAPNPTGGKVLTKSYTNGENDKYTFSFNLKDGWDPEKMSLIPVLFNADSTVNNVGVSKLSDALNNSYSQGKIIAGVSYGDGTKLKLYPNPTNQVLYIETSQSVNGNIQLVNLQGSVVANENINGFTHQLDVSHLAKGVYSIIINDGTTIIRQKVVVE